MQEQRGHSEADTAHEQGKHEGMGKPPVPERVGIADAEPEADDVGIRQNGAQDAEEQHPGGNPSAQECRQREHGCGVGKNCGHGELLR